jgi:hypothetical protein
MFKFIYQVASILPGLFHISNTLSFPAPNRPYNTSLTITAIKDRHRLDPFALTQQPRVLMISIFTPVHPSSCNASLSAYMEPTTAAFEDARLEAYG